MESKKKLTPAEADAKILESVNKLRARKIEPEPELAEVIEQSKSVDIDFIIQGMESPESPEQIECGEIDEIDESEDA